MPFFDDVTYGQRGASPWGVLYRDPAPPELGTPDQLRWNLSGSDPNPFVPREAPKSPFDVRPTPSPSPGATFAERFNGTGFGAGALPFSFAGPGSNAVDPSMIAKPPPTVTFNERFNAGSRTPTAAASAPATPTAAAPDSYMNIGDYSMPMFGSRHAAQLPTTAAVSASPPDFGDRLVAGLKGFAGGAETGLMSALAGGIEGATSGHAPRNETEKALLAKGVAATDVAAAMKNPLIMKALIDQHYGRQLAGTKPPRWDGRGRITR